MLKKTDAFLYSPGLPVRRIAGLLLPVILLLSLMVACQDPVPPEPYPDTDLLLEKLDVSCTEAWLKVSLSGTDSSAATAIPVILTRDGETLNNFSFTPPDTLIIDTGLEPARSYQYQAQRQSVHDNKIIASSNLLSVTTLDTTSHDFSWTIDTLGDYGSYSYFMDVAIIDENNIWAVGMITTGEYDSTSGTSYTEYNAAHWDGERWDLVKILSGHTANTGIMYFAENDIWVTSGLPIHWDGESWTLYHLWNMGVLGSGDGGVTSVWGSSPEDVWFVGRGGSIVHYDGDAFTKIDQSYDTDYRDVVGTPDGEHLFIVGNPLYRPGDDVLLYSNGDPENWEQIPFPLSEISGIELSAMSIDIYGNKLYCPSDSEVWIYNFMTRVSEFYIPTESDYGQGVYRMTCAVGPNDVFFGAGKMNFLHFNGKSYRYIDEIQYNFSHLVMEGGDYNGEVFAMVGYIGNWQHGIVARGFRY